MNYYNDFTINGKKETRHFKTKIKLFDFITDLKIENRKKNVKDVFSNLFFSAYNKNHDFIYGRELDFK